MVQNEMTGTTCAMTMVMVMSEFYDCFTSKVVKLFYPESCQTLQYLALVCRIYSFYQQLCTMIVMLNNCIPVKMSYSGQILYSMVGHLLVSA